MSERRLQMTKSFLARASSILQIACVAALAAACGSPGYNDNPSQRMGNPAAGCTAGTEFFAVDFSVHVMPVGDAQDGDKRQFRPYCNALPAPGIVFFTAEPVGYRAKRTPIGVRIVEQEFAGFDAERAENFQDVRTLAELPPRSYARGALEASFETDKNGYYAVYLSQGAADGGQEVLRIPLYIGVDPQAKLMFARLAGLFGVAAGFASIGYWRAVYKRKRDAR